MSQGTESYYYYYLNEKHPLRAAISSEDAVKEITFLSLRAIHFSAQNLKLLLSFDKAKGLH